MLKGIFSKTNVSIILAAILCCPLACQQQSKSASDSADAPAELRMKKEVLIDKIKGGWLGKTAGVCIGGPTEFKATGRMFTGRLNFYPRLDSSFGQDDIYVQITFVEAMDKKLNEPDGIFAATMADYGDAFKNSGYELWHANKAGRDNLRAGLNPPQSGMFAAEGKRFNRCANDIDWQIECDWIGLMCPAMPATAVQLSDRVGRVMNYGDGVYGGHFVTTMIALAFQYDDVELIVKKAIEAVPRKSQYYEVISDVIDYHDKHPDDFKGCWKFINDKWLREAIDCSGPADNFNIAASLNGAFIAVGLLYGDGDIIKTIEYSTRCGQDSDCNPANAGAIVGTMLGYANLPQQWKDDIEKYPNNEYSHTDYTYTDLINSSIARAEKAILQTGGTLSGDTYIILTQPIRQPKMLEQYGKDPVPNPDYKGDN